MWPWAVRNYAGACSSPHRPILRPGERICRWPVVVSVRDPQKWSFMWALLNSEPSPLNMNPWCSVLCSLPTWLSQSLGERQPNVSPAQGRRGYHQLRGAREIAKLWGWSLLHTLVLSLTLGRWILSLRLHLLLHLWNERKTFILGLVDQMHAK
jgi:hypothetical protein